MKKILVSIAVFAVVAAMVPAANANCLNEKIFSMKDGAGTYHYMGGFNNTAPFVGAFWSPGTRADNNEGAYDSSIWVKFYYEGMWYVDGLLGDSRVAGCPFGEMVVMVTQDLGDTATFVALHSDEDTGRFATFYYDNVDMTPLPQPGVTASSRDGVNVVVDLTFADVSAGYASFDAADAGTAISDIVLYTHQGDVDPGRGVGAWTLHSVIPYAGGATAAAGVTIDCSAGLRTYIAAGLRGTGEYDTAHVGASRFIECDAALADPDDVSKFDLIRERGQGEKKGKPFRDN